MTIGTAENVTQPELNKSLNDARLILYPVNVKPGERVIVDQNLLDSIPSNKYSDVVQQGSRPMSKVRRPSPNTDMESDENSSDATIPYVESTEPTAKDTKMQDSQIKQILQVQYESAWYKMEMTHLQLYM